MSSPVDIVSSANTAKGTSRSVSRNHTQKSRNVIANVTGWIAPYALVATQGYARYATARSPAMRSLPRRRLASQNTGTAPSATTAICASASDSGDGQIFHTGASRTRNGST